jgi:sarcosine oxidase subunit gamma
VVELVAQTPMNGFSVEAGDVRCTEIDPGFLTSIAPFRGREQAVSEALQSAHAVTLPGPNTVETGGEGVRAIWFGRGMGLLMGPAPDASLSEHAAVTDQSDAWCVVELTGAGAVDVLARLVPLDTDLQSFGVGTTARSLIGHMHGSVTRLEAERFVLMVFRSMAVTFQHDLERAVHSVAARAALM